MLELPNGSTIIDFAYSIHSEIGGQINSMAWMWKIVPISYRIKIGEVVSVLTSNNRDRTSSRDWLNVVKTSHKRNKIRNWFKKECREENIISGKQDFEKELKRNQINVNEDHYAEFWKQYIKDIIITRLMNFMRYRRIWWGTVI